MKSAVIFSIFLLACFVIACTEKKGREITVTNATNIERTDELIVWQRSEMENKLETISPDKFVTVTSAGRPVIVQYDDMDGDGNWDELSFLYSFKPNEKTVFFLSVAGAP